MRTFYALAVTALFNFAIADYKNCPLLGPDFPAPRNFSKSISWQNATNATTAFLQGAIAMNLAYTANLSFAIEAFSIHEPDLLYSFYHTPPVLTNSPGAKQVDKDSIFRIGSEYSHPHASGSVTHGPRILHHLSGLEILKLI
jgi:hypothetical protein